MNHRREMLKMATFGGSLKAVTGITGLVTLLDGQAATRKQPVLFIGHGSPMNAIANNAFTRVLSAWGKTIGKPSAVLVVSAHWLTKGITGVSTTLAPETMYDFSGFPRELSQIEYPAKGHPALAKEVARLLTNKYKVGVTDQWDLDHGVWSVLRHVYPQADVPVFQVSIDYSQPAEYHYAVGKELTALRSKGVLIVGSGNIVHNLRRLDFGAAESNMASQTWAQQFDDVVKQALDQREDQKLMRYASLSRDATIAVPTPDHYWPLLYAMGAAHDSGPPQHVYASFQAGTISMRCLQFS